MKRLQSCVQDTLSGIYHPFFKSTNWICFWKYWPCLSICRFKRIFQSFMLFGKNANVNNVVLIATMIKQVIMALKRDWNKTCQVNHNYSRIFATFGIQFFLVGLLVQIKYLIWDPTCSFCIFVIRFRRVYKLLSLLFSEQMTVGHTFKHTHVVYTLY